MMMISRQERRQSQLWVNEKQGATCRNEKINFKWSDLEKEKKKNKQTRIRQTTDSSWVWAIQCQKSLTCSRSLGSAFDFQR